MDVDLIFKIAAIGILVSVLNQVLTRSGRDEQATMTTLAGQRVHKCKWCRYRFWLNFEKYKKYQILLLGDFGSRFGSGNMYQWGSRRYERNYTSNVYLNYYYEPK